MKPTILVLRKEQKDIRALYPDYHFIFQPQSHKISFSKVASSCVNYLRKNNINIDGVIGTNDPSSIIAAYVANELKLPGPTLYSVYNLQHKGRMFSLLTSVYSEQPSFSVYKPNDPIDNYDYPIFVRPIKSYLSQFAYRVNSIKSFKSIMKRHSSIVDADIYNTFFQSQNKNEKQLSDSYLIQKAVRGKQYTLDGFMYHGSIIIQGITKSVREKNGISFRRFDHPATVSPTNLTLISNVLEKTMSKAGFDNEAFNAEFFITHEERVIFIEINTRISAQFRPLFKSWYEVDNFENALRISIGKKPLIHIRKAPMCASSIPLRKSKDHYIVRLPSREQIELVKNRYGVIGVTTFGIIGSKLSDKSQDTYSFRYAIIDIAGSSTKDISNKMKEVVKILDIRLSSFLPKKLQRLIQEDMDKKQEDEELNKTAK